VIDVVLPCLNEAKALPWVLSRIPNGCPPIVTDNGSTDGSAEVARVHGASVVEASPRGFGAAARAGLVVRRRRPMRRAAAPGCSTGEAA
jgi:glycosyltransferase involved in cell wall biosynthesis